jgi:hypothetical protein
MSGFNFIVVRSGKRPNSLGTAGGIAYIKVAFNGATFSSFTTTYYPGGTIPIPPVVGYTSCTSFTNPNTFTVMTNLQAAFEFNLTAVNTTAFTSKDFTAKLNGLTVTYSYAWPTTNPGIMNVDLFDMGDVTENGVIDVDDYNSNQGSRIARLAHDFALGGAHADFNNVDVTCAVRNDLFGTGAGDFSGFILKSPDSQYELVGYNPAPTLTINTGVPGPKCGGGGGVGSSGGCFIANAAR